MCSEKKCCRCFSHLFWTLVLSPTLGDQVKKVLNDSLHLATAHTLVTIAVEDPEK